MPWLVPFDELDTDQRRIIEEIRECNDNVSWIRGVAGTGKTAVLCHLIKESADDGSVCCVTFTHTLIDMIETGLEEIDFDCKVITKYKLKSINDRFKYIFCDEVQDMTLSDINYLRGRCDHLILAGDSGQSIYENCPQSGESVMTANQLLASFSPEEHLLTEIYRIPPSVQAMVSRRFPQMFNGTLNRQDNVTVLRLDMSFESQVHDLDEKACEYVDSLYPQTAVIIPSHRLIKSFCREISDLYGADPDEDSGKIKIHGEDLTGNLSTIFLKRRIFLILSM